MAILWLAERKYPTFAEAWDNAFDSDLEWLALQIDRKAEERAYRASHFGYRKALAREGINAARAEKWLIDYARKHNCLEEVE
jgi:hypothetical protein